MKRLLDRSRKSRECDDRLASRLVRAIRTGDSEVIREMLDARVNFYDDESAAVEGNDDAAEHAGSGVLPDTARAADATGTAPEPAGNS